MVDRSRLSNAFEFITLASARARQLMNGCVPRVGGARTAARLAQLEVLTGEVTKIEAASDEGKPPVTEPSEQADP